MRMTFAIDIIRKQWKCVFCAVDPITFKARRFITPRTHSHITYSPIGRGIYEKWLYGWRGGWGGDV